VQPGFAFAIPTKIGFAVGLVTHRAPKFGLLSWISTELFPDVPTIEQAEAVDSWRWPNGYHAVSALTQKLILPIGMIPIPPELRRMPRMRGEVPGRGWVEVRFANGEMGPPLIHGNTSDFTLPIDQISSHASLVQKIEKGWMPSDETRRLWA
jgi:hypothetical protein